MKEWEVRPEQWLKITGPEMTKKLLQEMVGLEYEEMLFGAHTSFRKRNYRLSRFLLPLVSKK